MHLEFKYTYHNVITLVLHISIVVLLCFYPLSFIVALPIRLADGSTFPFSGRVEVYRNGVWGTVCDKYWNEYNTHVVCEQLGYRTRLSLNQVLLNVPPGKGPILLENITCSHYQYNLLACYHNGFENHNCGHVEDVGVACLSDRKLLLLFCK